MKRLSILLLLAGLALAAPARAQGSERAVVESLHEVLLGCMKNADALGFRGRFERIAANLDRTFDLPFMARLALGSAWKELTPAQRKDFVALSRRFSAASYAHNFDGWGGERFETLGAEAAARGTRIVKTKLVPPKDDPVRFDYRLREAADGWRIIDVHLDGMISELTIRRAEYRSLIQRQGFDGLVAALEQKIRDYSGES
jgi:phospholipid transport system substrate-binding protein